MSIVICDIETGPLPEEQLRAVSDPYLRPERPGAFDPSAVKHGNTADPAKIAAKVQAKREEHEAMLAKWDADQAAAADAHWLGIVEKAALDARTGRVLVTGWRRTKDDGPPTIQVVDGGGDEKELLSQFWHRWRRCVDQKIRIVGFNFLAFDVPFMVRRSWLLGVPVPDGLLFRERYWHESFVDLMRIWGCGDYRCFVSLDSLARALGLPGKNGDGAHFHRLWFGTADERKQAIDYLHNDLEMTATVATALGVV